MEDTVFAGACVEALKDADLTDAAEAARILYREHRHNLLGMLGNCYHGRYLAGIGLAADIEFCAQINLVDIVPIQIDGQIS
jgi:2-phosphosulfolactate phosphatase